MPNGQRRWHVIDHLPVPVPFTRQQLADVTVGEFCRGKQYEEYYRRCVGAVKQSGRKSAYAAAFLLLLYDGRLPDLSRSVDPSAINKVHRKHPTEVMIGEGLNRILDMDLQSEFSNAAVAFEFLAISGDLAGFLAKQIGATTELDNVLAAVATLTISTFLVAMNVDLGNVPAESWRPFETHEHGPSCAGGT